MKEREEGGGGRDRGRYGLREVSGERGRWREKDRVRVCEAG